MPQPWIGGLDLVATAVANLALALMLGAWLAPRWLVPDDAPWSARIRASLRRCLLIGLGIAFGAGFALLWLEAASMAEVPISGAGPAVLDLLSGTHYGRAAALGIAMLVLVAGLSIPERRARSPARRAMIALALAGYVYSRSMVSHAADHGDASFVIALDVLHLTLIAAWVGAVVVSGFLVLPARDSADVDRRGAILEFGSRLSRAATWILVGVLLTGVAKAWIAFGGFPVPLDTGYARALAVKLALIAVAVALGGFNRFVGLPALLAARAKPGEQRWEIAAARFQGVLQIEMVFLVAALCAAAVLSASEPPAASSGIGHSPAAARPASSKP